MNGAGCSQSKKHQLDMEYVDLEEIIPNEFYKIMFDGDEEHEISENLKEL